MIGELLLFSVVWLIIFYLFAGAWELRKNRIFWENVTKERAAKRKSRDDEANACHGKATYIVSSDYYDCDTCRKKFWN